MSNLLQYKGYFGTVEYSSQDDCLFGKILGLTSLYLYEGNTVAELKADFEEMVDSYILDCQNKGIEPEKPYKGSFNVRVTPEVHKAAALYAIEKGITLNSLVERSLVSFISYPDISQGLYVSENKEQFKQKKKTDYLG